MRYKDPPPDQPHWKDGVPEEAELIALVTRTSVGLSNIYPLSLPPHTCRAAPKCHVQ